MKYFSFKSLYRNQEWISPAYVGVDANGIIQYCSSQKPEVGSIEYVSGVALPGFYNAHSHAFQYAMAGMAEIHPIGIKDDFWSWREAMYACALRINPSQMQAVATMLYAEMLRHGYTHVAEFHYLHHDSNGKPYANLAEMGERLVEAAHDAGIRITLIPVFYKEGGFNKPAQKNQIRFISSSLDDYFKLLESSEAITKRNTMASLGYGVHSLRAVNPSDVIKTFNQGPQHIPFHLHIAEQQQEVEDALAHLGCRPVTWLLDNLSEDNRVHVVHATHLTEDEVTRLAKSKASVILCPATEGNLGDGFFSLKSFTEQSGSWCIGSDSQINLNPLEDLRWLDYGHRLNSHQRNTFWNSADVFMQQILRTGRNAVGLTSAGLQVGDPLDVAVFDANAPLLAQTDEKFFLSTIMYTSPTYYGTMVAGKWKVIHGRHVHEEHIRKNFLAANVWS
jgi:formimidoylglutamate deiminase